MFCKKCGTQLNPDVRFCKKCGTPVATVGLASTPTTPIHDTQPQPYPLGWNSIKAVNKRALWISLAVLVAVIAIGYYFYSHVSIERKVENAIARGDLLKPPGECAYDYYQQLRQRGMSESVRARLGEKLLAATSRQQQMITNLASPGNPDATLNDWQEAQTLMNWASELRPSDNALAARASYAAGRAAFLSNRKDEAITHWKRAGDQDATWAMPLNSIGLIHNERKNFQMARSFFLEAIRRDPQFALPYNNIGTSFLYEKDDVQAENYYRQAIERAPQWPRPHAWLGEVGMRRKNYNMAAQEYEAVLNLDPSGTSGVDLNKIRQQLERARQSIGTLAGGEDNIGYTDIRGTIGNLKILFSFTERNGQVTGSYRYEGRNESLRLEGSINAEGVFTLTEFASDGRRTGSLVFKGTPTGDAEVAYAGTWTSADGQRKLPFKLEPVGD